MHGQTVLVTGGAGFIGGHIAGALVDDNEVRVLDHCSDEAAAVPRGAAVFAGDVRDRDLLAAAMADVDVVFHEAAIVSVERSVADPVGCHDNNVGGALAVLEAARERDATVVVASSAAVYGDPETLPVTEDHPKEPLSPYGVGKLAVDHYARRYHDLYGLDAVALRYFNVYGPGGVGGDYSGVVGVFLEQARAGRPLTVHGDGAQTRDFVHVDDVVAANLAAADRGAPGEAYNVGTGEAVSVDRLAHVVRDAAGTDAAIEYGEPRPGDVRHSRADVGKARRDLGFEPTVSLDVGIRELVERGPDGAA